MFSFTRSRPVLGAVALAVAAGCSDQATLTTPARSLSAVASTSRDAVAIPGRHIFSLKNGVPSDFVAQVEARGGRVELLHNESRVAITSGLSDVDAAALAGNGLVGNDMTARWVPTAQEMAASGTVSAAAPVLADGVLTQSPFNAFYLSQQWNMQQVHAPEAWAAGKQGSSAVEVAILDTGLDPSHLDLFGNIDTGASVNCLPPNATCVHTTTNWWDDYFHGTYVGSIISSNNIGVAGVARNVRLIAVKVLDQNGGGSFSALAKGLIYAATQTNARVINMSLGATFKGNTPGLLAFQDALASIVQFVESKNIVVVSSSGNDDLNLGNPHPFLSLPCEAGPQICVSATDARDMIARYSNFGRAAIDVAAPGGDDKHLSKTGGQPELFRELVFSACSGATPTSLCYVKPDPTKPPQFHTFYVWGDGTSASAPHVAGLAALIASQPGGSALTAAQIRDRIRSTADVIGNQSKFGDGRINVARALGVQ
jgi:thermitase